MKKTIFLLLIFFSSVSFAEIDCQRLWTHGFPFQGREHEPFRCLEHDTGNPAAKLYYPAVERADSETLLLVTHAAEALNQAYARFTTLGRMPSVKAVLYNAQPVGDGADRTSYAEAQVRWAVGMEACPILIYPAAKTFSPEYMKQLIAHELFHCFQKENFPEQTELAANPVFSKGLWWIEGTAQFFSNWVYPRVVLEYSPNFVPFSPAMPVTKQETGYGNVHFFQSLANQRDINFVLQIMRDMPTASTANQDAALKNIDGIQDLFHKFAKDMTAQTLQDSSGSIGSTPRVSVGRVSDLTTLETTQEREFGFMSSSIMPFTVKLPEKGNYRIQWVLPENAKGSYRYRGTADWQPLPENLQTPCEGEKEIEVLVTVISENPGRESVFLYVDREEKEDCPCVPTSRPTDSCLYGEWELDHESVLAFLRRTMPPDIFVVESSTGSWLVRMNSDGSAEWNVQNWEVITKIKRQTRR